MSFTPVQFLETYLSCTSIDECAAKLGVSKFTVERHARELRKKGVKVPFMRGKAGMQKAQVDVDALNALIEEKKGA